MELNHQKLVDAYARLISKQRDLDPITLAEKLVERLTYLLEDADEGCEIPPVQITREETPLPDPGERPSARSSRRPAPVTPMREKIAGGAPPVPASSLVMDVDESAYREALEKADPRLRGADDPPLKPPARPGRISNLVQDSHAGGNIQHWTIEELVRNLSENTPAEFWFVPNGCDEATRVQAVRNVQTIAMTQGPSIVRLEYTNPGVSGDRSSTDSNGQLDEVVLGLIASKTFTMDMPELNLERAMDEIEMQLKGLFAPRSSQTEPTGRDPGPIEGMFNVNDPKRRSPMGDHYEMRGETGWRSASPDAVRDSVIATNRRYGNR